MPFFVPGNHNADSKLNTLIRTLWAASSDSSAIANTVATTQFSNGFTIPANTIDTVGQVIECFASGHYSTTGTPTLALDILLSGDRMGRINAQTMPSSVTQYIWMIQSIVTVRATGASGSYARSFFHCMLQNPGSSANAIAHYISDQVGIVTSVDWTASVTCTPRATWGTASASNTITCNQFTVNLWTPASSS